MWKSTRFVWGMTATIGTFGLLAFAKLSDGGEVAAFSFLGTVALAIGASKVAEKMNVNKSDLS